jgi:D-serine deaminase-like pyridoxal phosphate-dependent protein
MDHEGYRFDGEETLRTPALVIYPDVVDRNVQATVACLGGEIGRWRPHVKTAKLAWTMRRLVAAGIRHVKCATSLELRTACEAGVADALLAYPVAPPHVPIVAAIAAAHPPVRVSAIVDDETAVAAWAGTGVGLFADVDVGMHRTGRDVGDPAAVMALARAIASAGVPFRGLHGYDGHVASLPAAEVRSRVHAAYDALRDIALALARDGLPVGEVITAGTPSLPHAAVYGGFAEAGLVHRVSPGTVVYNDTTSLSELPAALGYAPAALVLTTVVSRPAADRVTCDAGHKAVSADAGVPTCAVLGREDLTGARPSEEHLPLTVGDAARRPRLGERLLLVPRHVCPTVNNFDHAVIVRGGRITGLEPVTARGRDEPSAVSRQPSAMSYEP